MNAESKIVPVLREGIHIVKMVLYRILKEGLVEGDCSLDDDQASKLAGAVVNEIFGTPNREEPFLSFSRDNRSKIRAEMKRLAVEYPEMKIPLTDALRIQFLCDSREGFDDPRLLVQARDLGILMLERDLPLPDAFMALARRLGEEHNLTRQVHIPSA
ncbi:MAG: hypothetical protein HPY65_06195 [Syntrophaceae bacterium]|nr:hypothetical protein [Syntrophaceae bacterium]